MIAVFDRAKHGNVPPFPFHVYKLFILCRLLGGEFVGENEIPLFLVREHS